MNQDQLAPTPKGRERLDNILTVSTDLFLENGYDSVTLDDVIAKSGGSRATLYRAFGGKQQLFEAVINDFCSKFFEDLRKVDYTDLNFKDGFQKLANAYMAAALSPRHVHFYRTVMGTANRFPAVGEVWYQKGMKAVSLIFFDFLRSHIPAKNAEAHEIQQLADIIQGALIFNLLSQSAVMTSADTVAIDSTISAVARIAMSAYRDFINPTSDSTNHQ